LYLCINSLFYEILDFSLSEWLDRKGYTYARYLGTEISTELLEILGIVGYLNEDSCDRKSETYSPSVNGWKKGKC
jgi:hypothetical protein